MVLDALVEAHPDARVVRELREEARELSGFARRQRRQGRRRERFDLALVDEATQAIEPLSLLPFARARRVVLSGDHLQLPPTVISPEAARRGLSTSLFERLFADHGPAVATMLKEGRRMSTALLAFPSASLYGGALRAHPSVADRTLADRLVPGAAVDAPPVLFLDTRRMNVAITRARRHLFVVGDSATVGGHPFYRSFLEHVEAAGGWRSAWSWPEA